MLTYIMSGCNGINKIFALERIYFNFSPYTLFPDTMSGSEHDQNTFFPISLSPVSCLPLLGGVRGGLSPVSSLIIYNCSTGHDINRLLRTKDIDFWEE